MEGFLIFALVLAAIVLLFRYLRKREIEAFRQADMSALQAFNTDREKSGKEPVVMPDERLIARAAHLVETVQDKPEVDLRVGLFDEIHQRFYFELERALEKRLKIFAHVPMSDIVRSDAQLQNRLLHKTVSFVICDPNTLSVVAGIQLKNAGSDAQLEHDLKIQIFEQIAIPFITYPMIGGISALEILDQLAEVLLAVKVSCPDCGGETKLRKAAKGKNTGKAFKVCDRYPSCKGRVPVPGQFIASGADTAL
jgi:hypothetical protein